MVKKRVKKNHLSHHKGNSNIQMVDLKSDNSIFISSLLEPGSESVSHQLYFVSLAIFVISSFKIFLTQNILVKYFKTTFTQLNSGDLLKQIGQIMLCDIKALWRKPVPSKGFFMDTEI